MRAHHWLWHRISETTPKLRFDLYCHGVTQSMGGAPVRCTKCTDLHQSTRIHTVSYIRYSLAGCRSTAGSRSRPKCSPMHHEWLRLLQLLLQLQLQLLSVSDISRRLLQQQLQLQLQLLSVSDISRQGGKYRV